MALLGNLFGKKNSRDKLFYEVGMMIFNEVHSKFTLKIMQGLEGNCDGESENEAYMAVTDKVLMGELDRNDLKNLCEAYMVIRANIIQSRGGTARWVTTDSKVIGENLNDFPQKAIVFANAGVSIKDYIEQLGVPECLVGILDEHTQDMCNPLYAELELTDNQWEELDRDILALMVLDRNLKEYHTRSTPELYELYSRVSKALIYSLTEGHIEVNQNAITYDLGQKAMDSIGNLLGLIKK